MRLLIVVIGLLVVCSPLRAELIELEDFFRHPEFRAIQISPGGDYLAVTVPQEDRTGLAILDIRNYPDVSILSQFSPDREEHLGGLFWATEERLLMTSTRQAGSLAAPIPTGRVYATNADGSNRRLIYQGFRRGSMVGRWVEIIHRLPDDRNHVLVIERTHDSERPVARRMNIISEARGRTVATSPLSRGGLGTNARGEVLFAFGITDDYEFEFAYRTTPDDSWRTFDNPFGGTVAFHSFDESGDYAYVSTRDQTRMGLHRLHLASGRSEAVLTDERYEMLAPIWDMDQTRIIGAVFNTPIPEARWIEPDHPTARMVRSLMNALPNYNVTVSSYSDDNRRAVVRLASDREPGVFMLLDTETMALSELVAARQWVNAERMAAMRPVRITARDGLKLTAFLTVPNGLEEQDLPLVVEVHGGPHGPFDTWSWDPWVQAMANRGFAVLQVNFRGSGGYGQQFEESGYLHWGDKMQDDLTDAVRWAIGEGIAHPDRVCISGASYGGYSAMMSVIREPELYRCAFAFVGVYDLERARREGNIARRVGFGRAYLDRAIGTDPERLRAHSPVHHVSRVQAELFIAHGAADEQAHYNQFHVLIEALERANIAHDQLFVSGEGHGFYKLENNVKLYSRALDMFDRTIGSRWTPRDDSERTASLD